MRQARVSPLTRWMAGRCCRSDARPRSGSLRAASACRAAVAILGRCRAVQLKSNASSCGIGASPRPPENYSPRSVLGRPRHYQIALSASTSVDTHLQGFQRRRSDHSTVCLQISNVFERTSWRRRRPTRPRHRRTEDLCRCHCRATRSGEAVGNSPRGNLQAAGTHQRPGPPAPGLQARPRMPLRGQHKGATTGDLKRGIPLIDRGPRQRAASGVTSRDSVARSRCSNPTPSTVPETPRRFQLGRKGAFRTPSGRLSPQLKDGLSTGPGGAALDGLEPQQWQ